MPNKKTVGENLREEADTLLKHGKAKVEKAAGAVKEAVGKVANDAKLTAEGKAQKTAAKVKDAAASAEKKTRDTAEKVKSKVKK